MADDARRIRERLDVWTSAYNAGDMDTIKDLYTADCILLPPHSPAVTGKDDLKLAFQSLRDGGMVEAEVVTVETQICGGDVAFVRNTLSLKQPVVGYKTLEIWKKVDGEWYLHRDMFNHVE